MSFLLHCIFPPIGGLCWWPKRIESPFDRPDVVFVAKHFACNVIYYTAPLIFRLIASNEVERQNGQLSRQQLISFYLHKPESRKLLQCWNRSLLILSSKNLEIKKDCTKCARVLCFIPQRRAKRWRRILIHQICLSVTCSCNENK